jgi:hypothetical protein
MKIKTALSILLASGLLQAAPLSQPDTQKI